MFCRGGGGGWWGRNGRGKEKGGAREMRWGCQIHRENPRERYVGKVGNKNTTTVYISWKKHLASISP